MDEKDKRIKELEEEVKKLKNQKEKIEQEKKCIEDEKKRIEKEFENTKKEFEEFKALHTGTVQNLQKALKIKPKKMDVIEKIINIFFCFVSKTYR